MRKQKLSPKASKAKAIRDKKIAMTGHRKKRKRENERMGQRSDSDIHHTKDGKQVRVPIKDNRGNFGKGTKSEGPSMMGQTWLNRRIKGPNAEGDPVKTNKKTFTKGEGNIKYRVDQKGSHTNPHRIIFEKLEKKKYANLPGPPIQKVIISKKDIKKMPIGNLNRKSTTPKELESRQNMKMLTQTVMGTSGKREPALSYQKRKGLTDNQMYSTFPGLKPSKTK